MPTSLPAGPSRSRVSAHERRVGAAAELDLVGPLGGERRQPRRPRPDEQRHAARSRGVREPVAGRRAGRPCPRTRPDRRRAGARRSPTPPGSRSPGRRCSTPSGASQAPAASPRKARPREARSSAAVWPASSTGWTVNGFRQEGPTRTRAVARAISSRAGSAGWNQRSLYTRDDVEAARFGARGERARSRRAACRSATRARARARRVTSARRWGCCGSRSARSS